MIKFENIKKMKIDELLKKYSFMNNYFETNNFKKLDFNSTLEENINKLDNEELEESGIKKDEILLKIEEYIKKMIEFLGIKEEDDVNSISIIAGTNKFGDKEKYEELKIKKGEIICIVGPTGSGKSRLLADIEWVADRDTPTNRKILINGENPDKKWRFSSSNRLVAQLSQNMNFIMDLSVDEFLQLHAKSRLVENPNELIEKIINSANDLAGEKFARDTQITNLSGGQSRALMIADTAILSKSPIVLIDEIENAGVDRKRALELLIGEDKVVLMATHDPMLALLGNKRIVINNGGIEKIIETTEKEKEILKELEVIDKKMQGLRNKLRYGENLQ